MNRYIGKICPYCKGAFTEEDEVVICSHCEMPHHKECWIDNKGCTTFGCTGTVQGIDFGSDMGEESVLKCEQKEAVQRVESPAFCSKCGAAVIPGNSFCGKCGAAVMAQSLVRQPVEQKTSTMISKVLMELKTVLSEFKTSDVIDPEISLYIGSKSEYYIDRFTQLKQQKKFISWNWFAFIISPFWCLYRKLYIPGIIILMLDVVLLLIGGAFSSVLSIIIAVAAGLSANYFYMYDLERRMEEGKNLPEQQKIQYIDKNSDVNPILPSVTAVIYVLICVILYI